jgi:predicted NBD/HSP70 family sugar kinase
MAQLLAVASPTMPRAARARWSTATDLLRLVHSEPGITRREACDRLALGSGAAAELIERLRAARLLAEDRAQRAGPGRPTTVLGAHPQGPLIGIVQLRSTGWTISLGDLTGLAEPIAMADYGTQTPAQFVPRIAAELAHLRRRHADRLRLVVAAVAGVASGTQLLQLSTRGWGQIDLTPLVTLPDDAVPPLPPSTSPAVGLLVGNDATLGGLAEARTGAARGTAVALHIMVAVGLGGVLLVDGRPVTGALGAAGEYGHLPFGSSTLRCSCGARGCWDLTIDGRALARHLGDEPPPDPMAYAERVLAEIGAGAEVPVSAGADPARPGGATPGRAIPRGAGAEPADSQAAPTGQPERPASSKVSGRRAVAERAEPEVAAANGTGRPTSSKVSAPRAAAEPSDSEPATSGATERPTLSKVSGRRAVAEPSDSQPATSGATGRPTSSTANVRRAVAKVADSLGAGIAGLVNLHDPEVVTLGGLAPTIRRAAPEAFDRAYRDGLMAFRRVAPPPVVDGVHGAAGPVIGALALGTDEITKPAALAAWAATIANP